MGQAEELARFMVRNAAKGDSERVRRATLAECYYQSTQHDDKEDWYNNAVPIRARKPRIIVPLFRMAIEKVDRFLWSGHRFPSVVVGATKDEDGNDNEIGPIVDKEQAEILTTFAAALIKAARLKTAIREATTKVLTTTSAAIIVGVQAGYLNAQIEVGKCCTPTFSPLNPREVESLEIKYKFPRQESIGLGMTRLKWYWYRRVIDGQRDVTYEEQEVSEFQVEPETWTEDPAQTFFHGFGFCPVRWVRSFGDSDDPVDGKPMIDPALYPMLDAISYTVSMRQRAVERDCDPKQWAAGVEDSELEGSDKPGKFLTFENPQAKIGYVESQGAGVQRAADQAKDLTTAFREITAVVNASTEVNEKNVTGVALQMLYAPLIELASDLRVDLGDEAFCDLVSLAMRICVTVVQDHGEMVWVPGVKKATEILKSAQRAGVWLDPQIDLKWPGFFVESEQDKQFRITYTMAASGGKRLISQKTATQHIADTFDISDAAAEADAINEEDEEAAENAPEPPDPIAPPDQQPQQPIAKDQ